MRISTMSLVFKLSILLMPRLHCELIKAHSLSFCCSYAIFLCVHRTDWNFIFTIVISGKLTTCII